MQTSLTQIIPTLLQKAIHSNLYAGYAVAKCRQRLPETIAYLSLGCVLLLSMSQLIHGQDANLRDVPRDLTLPPLQAGEPSAGVRVKRTTTDFPGESVYHVLYLPSNWEPNKSWPILVEFAGNGNYSNQLGDISTGKPEDCVIGYGLSGGQDCIWVVLPYIEKKPDGTLSNALHWWGDISETKRYCLATLAEIRARYGGDRKRSVLCGFSRGAIGCNFFGLHDDEIAAMWCGFFCHSHYDGVRTWPYAQSDRESALIRLQRLGKRRQWISHENSVAEIENYLRPIRINGASVADQCTFTSIPFPNHSAEWLLCDLPERTSARKWLKEVLDESANADKNR